MSIKLSNPRNLFIIIFVPGIIFCFSEDSPFLGKKIVDLSDAPEKLVIRRRYQHKDITRVEMDFVCVGAKISHSRFSRTKTNGYSVRIKKKKRVFFDRFWTVKVWYGSNAHSEAGDEAKRIADAYHLPMGTCN